MIKKVILSLIFMILIAGIANAATTLTLPSSVNLGASSNQAMNVNVTSQFSITNSGAENAVNILISSTAASQYAVTFSDTESGTYSSTLTLAQLTPASSQTIYMKGFIPSNAPSGLNVDIGDITLQSLNFTSTYTISNFYINPSSKLEISDVNIIVDDDAAQDVSEDETIEDIKPGYQLEIEVYINNLFDDDDDLSIEDVRFEVTIVDLDDDHDVDEKSDRFDIDPEEEEIETVSLEVPRTANRGSYDVIIEANGRDENGTEHSDIFKFKISVERRLHDIEIVTAELSRNQLSTCAAGGYTALSVLIENIGRDEEDDVKLEIINSDLGLNYVKTGITLKDLVGEASSQFSTTIPITVPKGLGTGVYTIPVKVYFSDVTSDLKEIDLHVEACAVAESEPEDTEPEDDTGTGTEDVQPAAATSTQTSTESATIPVATMQEEAKTKFTESNWYAAILVIILLACVGAGIFIVIKFLLPKKE